MDVVDSRGGEVIVDDHVYSLWKTPEQEESVRIGAATYIYAYIHTCIHVASLHLEINTTGHQVSADQKPNLPKAKFADDIVSLETQW